MSLLDKIFNVPLLTTPQYGAMVANILAKRDGIELLGAEIEQAQAGYYDGRAPQRDRQTSNGVAIIPIMGSLANRNGRVNGMSSVSRGYGSIKNDITEALDDSEVHSVFVDMDSPGGQAAGCYELSTWLQNVDRRGKEIVAHVNGSCFSACYMIAAACDRIVASPTSGVGSIGVLLMHADHSGMMKSAGVDVTFVHAGAHKVDANPYEPLPEAVRKDLQKSVDYSYQLFVDVAAEGRSLDASEVRATEARCFDPPEAKRLGLIDDIGTADDVFQELSSRATGRTTTGGSMSASDKKPGADSVTLTPAELQSKLDTSHQAGRDEATTELTASHKTELDEAKATAVAEDRARAKEILESPEAIGREAMANKLAHPAAGKPVMSAEDAIELMLDAPRAEKAPEASSLSKEEQEAAAGKAGAEQMADHLGQLTNDIEADGEDTQANATSNVDVLINSMGG